VTTIRFAPFNALLLGTPPLRFVSPKAHPEDNVIFRSGGFAHQAAAFDIDALALRQMTDRHRVVPEVFQCWTGISSRVLPASS
jgi:hypothetical protein